MFTQESDMWPFKKSGGSFSLQTQTAAVLLRAASDEAAPHLLKKLVGEEHIDTNQELIAPLTLELLIFGLHLTDRIAFQRLGESDRTEFMDVLLPIIRSELEPRVGSQFKDLYNTRNTFYSGFRKLWPDKNESVKGTLFWEFGKALGSVYANFNPARIALVSGFGVDFMKIITQEFDAQKVWVHG
jgi:hypothetical protein